MNLKEEYARKMAIGLVNALKECSHEKRVEILDDLLHYVCEHCGKMYTETDGERAVRCQCWNDE